MCVVCTCICVVCICVVCICVVCICVVCIGDHILLSIFKIMYEIQMNTTEYRKHQTLSWLTKNKVHPINHCLLNVIYCKYMQVKSCINFMMSYNFYSAN